MGGDNIRKSDNLVFELNLELKNEQEPEIIEQIKKTINRIEEIRGPGRYIENDKKKDVIQEIEKLKRFKMDYENKRILEKIDEEIKIWESIKSCNYSDKSVIFNKNINVDEILMQLNKAKPEKKFERLETWPLSVHY